MDTTIDFADNLSSPTLIITRHQELDDNANLRDIAAEIEFIEVEELIPAEQMVVFLREHNATLEDIQKAEDEVQYLKDEIDELEQRREEVLHGSVENRCVECGVDMGIDNPRQYCGKTQCDSL
jgi:hypothetical protein